jgi:hypothetical protein
LYVTKTSRKTTKLNIKILRHGCPNHFTWSNHWQTRQRSAFYLFKKFEHYTYKVVCVLDEEHYRTVDAVHVPVQSLETKPVLLRAVDEGPGVANGAGWHVLVQL